MSVIIEICAPALPYVVEDSTCFENGMRVLASLGDTDLAPLLTNDLFIFSQFVLNSKSDFPCLGNMAAVAAHLRGLRPAPTSKKDTLMLKEKLKH